MNTKRKLQRTIIGLSALIAMAGCQREAVIETNENWNKKSPVAMVENGQIKHLISEEQMKELFYTFDHDGKVLEHVWVDVFPDSEHYGLSGEGSEVGGSSFTCWTDLKKKGNYLYW